MSKAVAALAALLILTGCSAPAEAPVERFESIETSTDCADLQAKFDLTHAEFETQPKGTEQSAQRVAYMEAAVDRMEELGCG